MTTDEPTCPKGCEVATPPERVEGKRDRFVCSGCGTEFTWRPPSR